MHRLRRTIFAFLAVLSLLLCFVVLAQWRLSYRDRGECWNFGSRLTGRYLGCSSEDGTFSVYYQSNLTPGPPHVMRGVPFEGWWFQHQFEFTSKTWRSGGANERFLHLMIPYWPAALTLAILPVVWLVLRITRKRVDTSLGVCAKCGYDLRATPLRCPECGTAAGAAKAVNV